MMNARGLYNEGNITRPELVRQEAIGLTNVSKMFTCNYIMTTPYGLLTAFTLFGIDIITQSIAKNSNRDIPLLSEFIGTSVALIDTLGWQGTVDAIRYEITGGEQGRNSQDILQDLGLID